jgi:hypothetical protein
VGRKRGGCPLKEDMHGHRAGAVAMPLQADRFFANFQKDSDFQVRYYIGNQCYPYLAPG